MKTSKFFIGLCILFMAVAIPVSAQSKKEKKEEIAEKVKKAIDSSNYKIQADQMNPMGGRTRTITPDYSVEIRNDSVFSYLPYFGRAYTLPYGGGNGLIFNAPLIEYKAEYHKKGKAEIEFTTRSEEDRFTYRITIFSNGSASISVNSTNRQPISYQGRLVLP